MADPLAPRRAGPRTCSINREKFCYCCAAYVKKADRRLIGGTILTYLKLCYPHENIDIRHSYQASSICSPCRINITAVGKARREAKRTPTKLRIKELAWWKRPDPSHDRCCLCRVDLSDLRVARHPENVFIDPNWSLVPCQFRGDEDHLIEFEPEDYDHLEDYDQIEFDDPSDDDYEPELESELGRAHITDGEQKVLDQSVCNDLVKVLQLDKLKSQLLASMIKKIFKNLKLKDLKVKITAEFYKNRTEQLRQFFTLFNETTVYLHDVRGFLESIGVAYTASEWRLFMDSSTSSFKACLIYNRPSSDSKKMPVIPLLYSTSSVNQDKLTESYEDLRTVLDLLNYRDENWLICCDFKILNVLIGLKGSYCKFCCIFCLWDSRDRKDHWTDKNWPQRTDYSQANPAENLIYPALVPIDRILMPPLHIKLGVFAQFIKSLMPFEGK